MGDPHTQVIIIITTINHKTMQMAVVLKNWNITKQQLLMVRKSPTKTSTHLYSMVSNKRIGTFIEFCGKTLINVL